MIRNCKFYCIVYLTTCVRQTNFSGTYWIKNFNLNDLTFDRTRNRTCSHFSLFWTATAPAPAPNLIFWSAPAPAPAPSFHFWTAPAPAPAPIFPFWTAPAPAPAPIFPFWTAPAPAPALNIFFKPHPHPHPHPHPKPHPAVPHPRTQNRSRTCSAGKKTAVTHCVTAVFLFWNFRWVSEVILPTESKKTAVTHWTFFMTTDVLRWSYSTLSSVGTSSDNKHPWTLFYGWRNYNLNLTMSLFVLVHC